MLIFLANPAYEIKIEFSKVIIFRNFLRLKSENSSDGQINESQ
jgi:hypothetical protein